MRAPVPWGADDGRTGTQAPSASGAGSGGDRRDRLLQGQSEFVAEALRTLLAARPDVRIAVAVKLYERGDIAIGKACEISGLDIESMKEELHRRGVRRPTAEDVSEVIAMAEAARRLAGR